MKKHLPTLLFVLIFLTGLSVLLYPAVSTYFNTRTQSHAIDAYRDHMKTLDPTTYDALLQEAAAYNESLVSPQTQFPEAEDAPHEYLQMPGTSDGTVGYLEIGSIAVSLPIYLGDSPSVLQKGVGVLPGSSLPIGGPGTHTVLTGHRGLPSSRLLTDLDQVAVGDLFCLHVLDKTLTYEVDQIRIVDPDDLTELAIQPEQDLCTLVTCTPYGINSHRMLVRGRRTDADAHPVEADSGS